MNAPTDARALLDGRYRVGSLIAQGGMSVVHRGLDTRLDRPVAIKIMHARLAADQAFRDRFEREARSAARIDHPAVVDVFDQGDDGPTLFIVMELVEGGTLRDVLRVRGPLGVPAAFAVLDPVLAGLAEAHRLGLVHRDVKPENVLISHAGEVKIADFGLVVAAAQAGASHAGMIMGTVAYLAPEQVATGTADARSDVYATGVLLYELLTGVPPYTGETAISVAYRHVNCDVPVPSLIAGDVPPELDAFVRRATRREPAERPADAATMLAELRALATTLEVPRVPAPAPPPRPVDEQDTLPAAAVRATNGAAAARPSGGPRGTQALSRPDEPDELPPHLGARRRSRRTFAAWTAVVLALALLIAVSAWWLGAGRWTATPSLVGLQQAAAERLLAEADLVATVTTKIDDRAAAGVVVATDPGPTTQLLRGSTVVLTISSGPPTVPAIAPGTAVPAAEEALRAARLEPARRTAAEFSDTVPEGAVIRTDPPAGTTLTSGAPVTLVLSRGVPPPGRDRLGIPSLIDELIPNTIEIPGRPGFGG